MNKRYKQKFGKKFKIRRMYDLCDYLGKDILRDLKAFQRVCSAAPMEICEKDDLAGVRPETEKKWKDMIGKMIWSFEEILYDRGNAPGFPWEKTPEMEAYNKRVDEGLQLFAHHFKDLWF